MRSSLSGTLTMTVSLLRTRDNAEELLRSIRNYAGQKFVNYAMLIINRHSLWILNEWMVPSFHNLRSWSIFICANIWFRIVLSNRLWGGSSPTKWMRINRIELPVGSSFLWERKWTSHLLNLGYQPWIYDQVPPLTLSLTAVHICNGDFYLHFLNCAQWLD